jgi:hypothetical protein
MHFYEPYAYEENGKVPQGLKPQCKRSTCGTAEAVPLTKPELFPSL